MSSTERKILDVDGAQLEVWIGAAPYAGAPIVCAAHPADLFTDETVALLGRSARARIVCVNPRGETLERQVDELEAVRARLGFSPWTFWGMSGGGWLAQLYAQRHPAGLGALIVESACACFRARLADAECLISPFHAAWRAALDGAGLLAEGAHDSSVAHDELEWLEVAGVGSVLRRRGGAALLVAPAPLSPAMVRMMPRLIGFDSRAWLASVRTPALVVCGGADPIVPVAHARAVHRAMAGSELVIVDGAGHVPVLENRVEIAHAVERLLARRGTG